MVSQKTKDEEALFKQVEMLFKADTFSESMDIRLEIIRPGFSEVSMLVDSGKMNAHQSAHGGAVWTLADMAFGSAGFYDGPILTTESTLSFLRPSPANVRLVARATQVTRRGKSGIFHIIIGEDLDAENGIFATGQFSGRWRNSKPLNPTKATLTSHMNGTY